MAEQGAGPSEPSGAVSWFYEADAGRRLGPYSAHVMREFVRHGTISADTRVWTEAFGDSWKPLSETDLAPDLAPLLAPVSEQAPAPPPAVPLSNALAWLIAVLPLLAALAEKALGDALTGIPPAVRFLPLGVALSTLAFIDAGWIARSGRNTRGIALQFWFWLIPAYLVQRARALERSYVFLLLWIGSTAAAVVISNPYILTGNIYWGVGVPTCDGSFAADQVKTIFGNIPTMQTAGIQVVAVQNAREASSTDTGRQCLASALATNGRRYTLNFTIEQRNNGFVFRVYVMP